MRGADFVRRAGAEAIGTGALVAVVVGSGIAASSLSADSGIRLLANSLATALGLTVIIVVVAPVSGAHLNPIISLVTASSRARAIRPAAAVVYVTAQMLGAVLGAVVANAMFELAPGWSTTERGGWGVLLGEVVATAGLVVVVVVVSRSGAPRLVAPVVGAYIGAAYWFTSSTSFANPAVTVGRMVTDTFAGIAPGSVPAFLAAQLVGGAIGAVIARGLSARPVAAAPLT